MLPTVEYLGHRISADSLQATDSKIKALKEAPTPQNVSQLKAFLGLVNYYGKFIPNLSTLLAPLHRLLQKSTTWTCALANYISVANSASQMLRKQFLHMSGRLMHGGSCVHVATLACKRGGCILWLICM